MNASCLRASMYASIGSSVINLFASLWDFGNFFFTGLFNMINGSHNSDILCCAKAFYKDDVRVKRLTARGFDIDVELASTLLKKFHNITTINISYSRRHYDEGKKIRFSDGWKILNKILLLLSPCETAIIKLSTIFFDLSIISIWPFVNGSKLPGYIAIFMLQLSRTLPGYCRNVSP